MVSHVRIHHPIVVVRMRWLLLLNYGENNCNNPSSFTIIEGTKERILPSTNNCVQQHVGNWVEVFDGADNYEAAYD
jgi:hypothetical protein